MDLKVKRDFVLEVSIIGDVSPQTIMDAITTLRAEAQREWGDGYQERADVVGPPPFDAPANIAAKHPRIIFRAFPHQE